ncbi:MAG: MnhB domain-containing protein [Planctomycetota bacterium]|nr:MnhB domain-containing protein [Planctomycetota bacterium]
MKGMTPIVRNITAIVSCFVMLYGVYVVCTGHLAPGGGFAGGVIIMGGLVMLVLAFGGGGKAKELIGEHRCHVFDGLGALVFALIAIFGFFAGGFFVNFLPKGQVHKLFSGGTILPANIAIGLKVSAGLIGIFLALVLGCREALFRSCSAPKPPVEDFRE